MTRISYANPLGLSSDNAADNRKTSEKASGYNVTHAVAEDACEEHNASISPVVKK
jgi:hypothetical protein